MDELEIPILETERLRLRALRLSDFVEYAALRADSEVMRHLKGTWDGFRSWRHLAFLIGHRQLAGSGTWAVEHKESVAFAGVVGFCEPEGWPGLELAWALGRRFWGRGYAVEAARAALSHAFDVWRRERVISLIPPENAASVRVAERLGQSFEGRIEHFGREMLCYGISRAVSPSTFSGSPSSTRRSTDALAS